ncbi:DUF4232 domain-containing protein [Streptomyces fradiae]|jgi:hypothetical protein|uniref:DUF4232 domain-containing protein n=1 Tax=Streptomyces rubrolavendulae TaxID=285473 RepID=A0A1D8G3Q8_9ACTN|nr:MULTISPECIES: DUF4232 domain-containing protein [Streptomyces]AOT60071.1 hypothetical protein A4G23_02935 [Streptomyces rubrolavendulae]UQS31518.1 DUF4232 domain-containing protein [Streptomyces fradiae]
MRTRGSAALAAAVSGVLAVSGCVAEGGAGAGSSGPSAVARERSASPGAPSGACPESGVRVSLGDTEAAMGQRALSVFLDNCGSRPFEVGGYPDVAVLDERGEDLEVSVRLGSRAVDGGAARSEFVLRPGQRARSGVLWRNTVTRSDVVATNGASLRVAPGPGAAPQTVAPHDGPLDLGNTGTVEVLPWAPARAR